MKKLILTVTNELNFDQRMHRIAGTLHDAGYSVLLVGRAVPGAPPLAEKKFQQKRLKCFIHKGPLFYIEFNLRLFFFLLFQKADLLCAIDLDTILPCYVCSVLKRQHRVYDAHELFTEQIEVIRRPRIARIWRAIEKFAVPRFKHGYTVNGFIVEELERRYGVHYQLIPNLPVWYALEDVPRENYFLYQGSVNEGRCFETLIPAMKQVPARLLICGRGNFTDQTQQLIRQHGVANKVTLIPPVPPEALRRITQGALAGITLFEQQGLNQYQSLANRFFDYMMAGIPQLCVDYPEYRKMNDVYGFALLTPHTDPDSLARSLNNLLQDNVLLEGLQQKALAARSTLNWEPTGATLLLFYERVLHG